MQFSSTRPARRARENIVPMINVVFLLLIFFLMTAQIAPPEPFPITPPGSTSQTPAKGQATLYIAADGALAMGDARGDAVFAALAGLDPDARLLIRADGGLKGRRLAQILTQLAAAGVSNLALITSATAKGTP